MKRNILYRLLASIVVLILVSILAFLLVRLGGGDPARIYAGEFATEEDIEYYRIAMGLDKPWIVQYFNYIKGILQGDLGYSYTFNTPVSDVLASRVPNTLRLSLFSLVIGLVFSLIFGIIAGVNQGTGIDMGAMVFAVLGQSMSTVWLGFMLILLFGVTLGWLPIQGMGGLSYMIMPGLCITFGYMAHQTRLMRSSMVDVINEDYITATRARGVSKWKTYAIYALKNALLPVITNTGSRLGHLLAGATVVENIFGWPGMGQVMVQAINKRDYQLIQSVLLISSAMIVMGNIISDVLYMVVDPRISFN